MCFDPFFFILSVTNTKYFFSSIFRLNYANHDAVELSGIMINVLKTDNLIIGYAKFGKSIPPLLNDSSFSHDV